MIISLIAAMSRNRVIGKNNKLPWDMPADMNYFRNMTKNKPVIMGRKTYESIGRPMPDRINIIITRDKEYKAEGCIVVSNVDDALKSVKGNKEVMVIGGAQIYKEFLPKADRIYLTIIDEEIEGDTYFPEFNKDEWKETKREEHKADKKNPYPYTFLVLERK